MNDPIKVQTALRFDKDLLALVKEKARAQRRSLNNYIEILLLKDVGHIPNEQTVGALKEAETTPLEKIEDLDTWLDTL